MKFAVIFWNIRVLRICLDLVSVTYSVKTELGKKNTFFLACLQVYCIYSDLDGCTFYSCICYSNIVNNVVSSH